MLFATTSASAAADRAAGEQYRGYLAAKRRFFYGVRVTVVVTVSGVPVELVVMPGSLADLHGLSELPLDLPVNSELAADAAYTNYEWEEALCETDQLCLLVQRKTNTRRRDEPALHDYKFWLRRRIETVFGEIAKMFAKKIHATNLSGFILKIVLFVFAYQLDTAFINNYQLGLIKISICLFQPDARVSAAISDDFCLANRSARR